MNNQKVKVIFLDIDGVLNHELWFQKRTKVTSVDDIPLDKNMIDPDSVKVLNRLVKDTNSKIVLSSTWRMNHNTIEKIQQLFGFIKLEAECIGLTPIFRIQHEDKIISVSRGMEIQYWLENTKYDVEKYVIIDDDSDMLLSQRETFFQTDFFCGLTNNLALKIRNYLNGTKIY